MPRQGLQKKNKARNAPDKLQLELEGLKTETALLQRQATKGRNVVDKVLKTDAKIRTYLQVCRTKTLSFNNLIKYVTQKSKNLRYSSKRFKKGYFNQGS